MKKKLTLPFVVVFFIMFAFNNLQAQEELVVITGRVLDQSAKEPLLGANVLIKNTLTGRISHGQVDLSELGPNADELLSKVEHIQILACGTSYNSGMVSRYWFESLAGIPCDVEIASEFRYREPPIPARSPRDQLEEAAHALL